MRSSSAHAERCDLRVPSFTAKVSASVSMRVNTLRDFRPENWRIQGGKSLEPFWERRRHAVRRGYFVKPPARTVSLASNARSRHRYHRLSI